jgi:hypothetical protein
MIWVMTVHSYRVDEQVFRNRHTTPCLKDLNLLLPGTWHLHQLYNATYSREKLAAPSEGVSQRDNGFF